MMDDFTPTIPPPDPNTKSPKFKLSPKATDAHCHIFGPAAQYPYAAGRSYTPPDSGLDKFRALQAKLGLTRAVIVNASCYGNDNKVALDAIAQQGYSCREVRTVEVFAKQFFECAGAWWCRCSGGSRGC